MTVTIGGVWICQKAKAMNIFRQRRWQAISPYCVLDLLWQTLFWFCPISKIDFAVYCRNGYGSLLIHNNASSISLFLFSFVDTISRGFACFGAHWSRTQLCCTITRHKVVTNNTLNKTSWILAAPAYSSWICQDGLVARLHCSSVLDVINQCSKCCPLARTQALSLGCQSMAMSMRLCLNWAQTEIVINRCFISLT